VTLAAAGDRGRQFVVALGGAANLKSIDACTTRLRLDLADSIAVNEPALRALGARGIVRPGGNALQVVIGPIADQVAGEIRAATATPRTHDPTDLAMGIVDVLGPAGITEVSRCGSRLVIDLNDVSAFSAAELERLSTRGWVALDDGIQIVVGPDAETVHRQIEARLAPA
jgi:PTS system N-acetylglucosamine-specific IIC component